MSAERCGPCEATIKTAIDITKIHILKRRGRRRLPEVDALVAPVRRAHEHETATAYAGVLHANDADAGHRRDHCIRGIAAAREDVDADLAAHTAFRCDPRPACCDQGREGLTVGTVCWVLRRRGTGAEMLAQ
ncbi:hypothetical protein MRB53_039866 [Persea americana]|nr:hypothetical protein MRB53_039866 [Persea americana]